MTCPAAEVRGGWGYQRVATNMMYQVPRNNSASWYGRPGMQRIVDSGRITAAMRFHTDTRSAAEQEQGGRLALSHSGSASAAFGVGAFGRRRRGVAPGHGSAGRSAAGRPGRAGRSSAGRAADGAGSGR